MLMCKTQNDGILLPVAPHSSQSQTYVATVDNAGYSEIWNPLEMLGLV